ncbi:hypothetical protein GC102_33460 [Paenibacillus sp. LMG 31460]|uniref:Uncharacterized protein n=1 Tax=Paenibacillus germinis TaxID=2654979 RepID=A0ABX1ZFD4_9BACL|nr:hypothetical protein [Paenibacillus germinis]NOU90601.1 hypothetical protein [Paenibacillus germinis]
MNWVSARRHKGILRKQGSLSAADFFFSNTINSLLSLRKARANDSLSSLALLPSLTRNCRRMHFDLPPSDFGLTLPEEITKDFPFKEICSTPFTSRNRLLVRFEKHIF